jgi:hypothetical protein
MNPFATIPIDPKYREFHQRYPALNLIGNTRMVEILCFKEEFPEVSIYAKAEYANPGGSLKDRPVRRMLLEAQISVQSAGCCSKRRFPEKPVRGRSFWIQVPGMQALRMPCWAP